MMYRAYAKDACWESPDGRRTSFVCEGSSATRCALEALKMHTGLIEVVDESGEEVLSNGPRMTHFSGHIESYDRKWKFILHSFFVEVDVDVNGPISDWTAKVTKVREDGRFNRPYTYMIGGKKNV